MSCRPSHRGLLALAMAAFVLCGCAASESGTTGSDPIATPPTTRVGGDFVRNTGSATDGGGALDDGASGGNPIGTDDRADPDGTERPGAADVASSTTIPVVSDTGVPGLDSGDAFCRSWSEFAGSFQALGLVSAFGDPVAALRLEVIASPAVLAAVDGLDAALPAALADERSALVESYAGPFARRAARARDELVRAGIGDPDRLGPIWLTQLAEQGVDDPALTVTLPADVDPKAIESAMGAFGAAVPSIVQDPSLITAVAIPATESYLAANCPDQGILGGNDVVQS